MTEYQLKEQDVRIARYRDLEREVTDPFAVCLLRTIIDELEADRRTEHESDRTGLSRAA